MCCRASHYSSHQLENWGVAPACTLRTEAWPVLMGQVSPWALAGPIKVQVIISNVCSHEGHKMQWLAYVTWHQRRVGAKAATASSASKSEPKSDGVLFRDGLKGIRASVLLSWIAYSGGIQVPCLSTLKQVHGHIHVVRDRSLLPKAMWENHLEEDPPAPIKPSDDDHRHSQHPDLTFTTDPNTEPPDKPSSNSWPRDC